MRDVAAFLLTLLTIVAVIAALWITRRRNRRDSHSLRFVIQPADEAEVRAPEARISESS